MDDAVDRYCAASEANDVETLMGTLSADVEIVSPLSGRLVFRGREDARILLAAVYGMLRDLRWDDAVGDGHTRAVAGEARVGPFTLGDAMICELDGDGLIKRVRPHLRPWLATTLFALVLGPRVAAHPAIVLRALRRA